jgi:uncharacterized protein (DUF2147 family)
MRNLLLLLAFLSFFSTLGQSIEGKWKTIDDESGKPRSVVEIYQKDDGLYYGKITEIFAGPDEDPDPICDNCPKDDPRYMKPVLGMEIIKEMKYDDADGEYSDGVILDPEDGNEYDCKLWMDETGNLRVRGYVAFFYRTQTWLPYEG